MPFSLDLFACPLCKEKVNAVTNLRIHIACCKSDPIEVRVKRSIASPSPVTSSEESSKEFSNDHSELRTTQQIHKAYGPRFWGHVKIEKVDRVPVDIDGLKHYKVKHENRSTLLAKSRDGRKKKKDSHTNWKNFETVRYKDCNGSLYCPNLTVFICKSILEKMLYILTRKVTVIYVVLVEFLTLVRQGSIQLLKEIQHMFFMLDHMLAYQKMYVSDLQKL